MGSKVRGASSQKPDPIEPRQTANDRAEATVETLWDRQGATPYQTRVKCGQFRIHIFWRGDRDPDHHDHPSDFWTLPLVSYVEEVLCRDDPTSAFRRVVLAFRPHRRRAEHAHRVLGAWSGESMSDPDLGFWPGIADRPIVTLGWWGRKRREWGFWTANGWVPWRTYVNAPGWDSAPVQPDSEPTDAALQVISGTAPEALNPPQLARDENS